MKQIPTQSVVENLMKTNSIVDLRILRQKRKQFQKHNLGRYNRIEKEKKIAKKVW